MEGTLAQHVLKVALLFSVLEGKNLPSSREGAWDRVRKGLVPLSTGERPHKGFLDSLYFC